MDALYAVFKERAEAASAEVHRFPDPGAAVAFLGALVKELGGDALWADGPYLRAAGRPDLPGVSYEVTREAAAHARVGISQMDWALADTGTVVQDASAADLRLVSTLPPVHVALVAAERVLPDLAAALEVISPDRAGFLALITGPSRTADIERVLTIGVHGPGRLIVLMVEGLAS